MGIDDDVTPVVTDIEEALHARGWAEGVTLPGLLKTWETLSANINQYEGVIEEYLDDMTNRDALKEVLTDLAHPAIIDELRERVARADETFRENTQADDEQELRRYFRITDEDDWWWHRIPTTWPLAAEADFAAEVAARSTSEGPAAGG